MPQIACTQVQSKANNCGAYALAAIAETFGVLPVEKDIKLIHDSRNSTLTKEQTKEEAVDSIYMITGNLSPNGKYTSDPNGTNSPSALSYVARQLGLIVDVKVTTDCLKNLIPFYPGELDRCRNQANSVDVSATNYVVPTADEIPLICVANHFKSLHWIVQGNDGLYYDPAVGTNDNLWASPEATGSSIGCDYMWAGLWMVFRRNP